MHTINMAASTLFRCTACLFLLLSLVLLLESLKTCPRDTYAATSLSVTLNLDVKQFPGRRTSRYTARYTTSTKYPLSYKFKAGLRLISAGFMASFLVLLSVDVSLNPGPTENLYDTAEIPKLRGLKIAHLNVRSILNKMDDVRSLAHNKRFDIFTFSETWLNPSIKDFEVHIPGYTLVRQDRTGKRGGGTAIYVRNGIPYKHRQDLSAENIKSSWVEVNRLKCKKLFVGCVYRPPNACSDTFIDLLNNSLLKLPTGSHIVLLGGVNIDFLMMKR